MKYELRGTSKEELHYELRIPIDHKADRLSEMILAIDPQNTTAVELEGVFREVISRFVESADRERFAITISPDAERVLADHERLALVIACLIDNALKFSPESEPVRVNTRRMVNKVHIEVRDNGRRIPDSATRRRSGTSRCVSHFR